MLENFPSPFSYERDPDDAHYVNLALAAGAKLIVSGDDDLLDLMKENQQAAEDSRRQFPTRILNPVAFLRELDVCVSSVRQKSDAVSIVNRNAVKGHRLRQQIFGVSDERLDTLEGAYETGAEEIEAFIDLRCRQTTGQLFVAIFHLGPHSSGIFSLPPPVILRVTNVRGGSQSAALAADQSRCLTDA